LRDSLRIVPGDGVRPTTPKQLRFFAGCDANATPIRAFIPTPYRWIDEQWNSPWPTNSRNFIGTRTGCASETISRRFSLPERFAPIPKVVTVSISREEAKTFGRIKIFAGKILVHDKREPYGDTWPE